MSYLNYFFNPSHLFSLRPPALSTRALLISVVLFATFVVIGLLGQLRKKQVKSGLDIKVAEKTLHLGLTIGLVGLVYTFFAWQGVTLLAARFWLVLILIIALAWAGSVVKYAKIDLPKVKKDIQKDKEFRKYIP